MKRATSALIAGALIVTLSGCSQSPVQETTESSSEQTASSSQKNIKLELDNTYSANGLSFKYPSEWEVNPDSTGKASTYIDPGGVIQVNARIDAGGYFFTKQTDEKLDEAFDTWFKEDGDTASGFYRDGEPERHYNGEDLYSYQKTAIRFRSNDGDDYYGHIFLGLKANERVLQCVAVFFKNDVPQEYKDTSKEIIDSVSVDVSEIEPVETSNSNIQSTNEAPNQNIENPSSSSSTSTQGSVTITTGQKNALRAAKNYVGILPLSRQGLIDQLVHDQYSIEDATYAADNCGADWMAQAVKSAQNYIELMPFSHGQLVDQLVHDGFTQEEAEHGVSSVGL